MNGAETARPTADDAALVQAAVGGDQAAYALLVERHYSAVFLTARARLHDHEAAEDLTQEVFLRTFLHLNQLQDAARFPAWACRIARNLAEDWRRQNQRTSRLLPMVPLEDVAMADMTDPRDQIPRQEAERLEREAAVRQCLASLAPEAREVMLLAFVEELSDRAIADRLSVHHTTVRYHRLRAMDAFRLQMQRLLDVQVPSGSERGNSGDRVKEWMASAVPSLRPSRAKLQRVTALVAAVAALPQPAKAALTATSSASMPATASSSLPLLNTLGATASAGAWIMKGKIAAAVAAAAALYFGASAWKPANTSTPIANSKVPITISITPSTSQAPGSETKADPMTGVYTALRTTLPELIGQTTHQSTARVLVAVKPPTTRYDVKCMAPPANDRNASQMLNTFSLLEAELKRVLEKDYQLTFAREKQMADVYVLRALPESTNLLKTATGPNQYLKSDGRSIESPAATIDRLARNLEFAVGRPIVDESALSGTYQFKLQWDRTNKDSIAANLRTQLGLELVPERRELEFVVIRSTDPSLARAPITLSQAMAETRTKAMAP